jgi:hypothetical protein
MSGVISSFPPQFGQERVMKSDWGLMGAGVSATWIGAPHLKQKRAPATFAAPQDVQ